MTSKSSSQTRLAREKPAEGRTMMEAPSARYAALVLDDAAALPEVSSRHPRDDLGYITPGQNRDKIESIMKRPSGRNTTETICEKIFDTAVQVALSDSDMSKSQRLQAELEVMEGRIAELLKDEFGAYERLIEAQREKDDVVQARITVEEAANVIREALGRPAASIVVRQPTGQPTKSKPSAVVPRRQIQEGTRLDQFLTVLRPLMMEHGGLASRQEIRQAWDEAGLFEEMKNVDSTVDSMLSRLKGGGYITTEYRGTWKWTGIRETKTVEP